MELVAVQDIDAAFARLEQRLREDAEAIQVILRTPVSADSSQAFWHEREGVWAILDKDDDGSRYWCSFGSTKPIVGGDVYYDCMINVARHAKPWNTAGALAEDPKTRDLYYLHSGRIAKNSEAFAQRFHGEKVTVRWPDGKVDERYIVGKVNDKAFVTALAAFVKAVAGVKNGGPGGSLEVHYRTALIASVDAAIQQLQAMNAAPGMSVSGIRLQRLEDLQQWLQDDPELLQSAVERLTGEAVQTRRRQLILSSLAAIVSIIAGWLLSAIKPETVLLTLSHLGR